MMAAQLVKTGKKALFGTVAALLLAPIPVFALDLSAVTWATNPPATPTPTSSLFTLDKTLPFDGIDWSNSRDPITGKSQTTLTFVIPANTLAFGTTTMTSSVLVNNADGKDFSNNLNGVWAGLTALNSVTPLGSGVTVSIGTSGGPPPSNMFSALNISNAKPLAADPAISSIANATGSVITVTFNYSGGVTTGTSSTTFTLTFSNSQ
jgi:hypothetical protein